MRGLLSAVSVADMQDLVFGDQRVDGDDTGTPCGDDIFYFVIVNELVNRSDRFLGIVFVVISDELDSIGFLAHFDTPCGVDFFRGELHGPQEPQTSRRRSSGERGIDSDGQLLGRKIGLPRPR